MILFADVFVAGLLRASLILSAAAVLVAVCIRLLRVVSPRSEQWAWLFVLLQGVIVAPIFIPLPESWQRKHPAAAVAVMPLADQAAIPLFDPLSATEPGEIGPAAKMVSSSSTTDEGTTIHTTSPEHPSSARLPRTSEISFAIWGTGLLMTLLIGLLRYRQFLRQLQSLQPPLPEWQAEWRSILREANVRSQVELAVSIDVGPVLCRFPRRAYVVVPESLWTELTAAERTAILRHEVEHIRRGDLWWTLIVRALNAVHWFNPFAWWAAANFEAQGEFVCDQAAGANGRLQFADLLLRLGTGSNLQPAGVKAVVSGRMYQRIERLIVGTGSSSRWRTSVPTILAAMIAAVAGIRFEYSVAAAVAQDQPTEKAADASSGSPPEVLVRLGTVPFPMSGFPSDIAFSPDGQHVAASEANNPSHTVRLFDLSTGGEIASLSDDAGTAGWVQCFAFSPDGKQIAGGDYAGQLIVWDVTKELVLFRDKIVDDRITEVAYSPDGKVIAVAGSRSALQLRSTEDPSRVVRELQLGAAKPSEVADGVSFGGSGTGSIAFTSDSARLISTNQTTGTVLVWDVSTGTLVYTFNAITGDDSLFGPALTSVAVTPDGKSVLTSGFHSIPRDETTLAFGAKNVWRPQNRLWELETGRMLRDLSDEHEYGPGTAALFPDPKRLIVHLYDQLVIRDTDTLDVERRIPLEGQSGTALTLSPDGRHVALQLNSRLAVFDTTTGERLHYGATAGTDYVMSADWSRRGDRVATCGNDGNVRVWDVATGEQLWSRPLAPYIAPTGDISRPWFVALEPNFQTVITAGDRDDFTSWRCGTVTIFDAATGQVRGDVSVRKPIRAGAVAPNGRSAVFAGNFGGIHETQLYGVDLTTLKIKFVSPPDDVQVAIWDVKAIQFLPDSSAFRVATGDSQILEFDSQSGEQRSAVSIDWRTEEQRAENKPKTPQLWEGAFTPDAALLVSSSEDQVYLWDCETGEQKLKIQHPHKKGCRLAISPDGQTIVTSDLQYAGDHGTDTIRVFNAMGKQLRTWNPGEARANVLLFSPDGTKLFNGFFSEPPAIWDMH